MLSFPMLLPLPSCRHLVGPAGERGGTKKTKSSCKALEVPSPHPGSRYFIPKSPPQPPWQPPPGSPNSKCFLYNWSKHRVSIVRLLIFYYFVRMWEWIFTKPALLSGFIQTKTVNDIKNRGWSISSNRTNLIEKQLKLFGIILIKLCSFKLVFLIC